MISKIILFLIIGVIFIYGCSVEEFPEIEEFIEPIEEIPNDPQVPSDYDSLIENIDQLRISAKCKIIIAIKCKSGISPWCYNSNSYLAYPISSPALT